MSGLAFLLFFGLYFVISRKAVRVTVAWAKANNKSTLLWGSITTLAMVSIIFWDVIPIYASHSYLCATESGFTINKTTEQWKQENPRIAEILVPYDSSSPSIDALPPEKYLYKTELKYPEGINPIILRKHFRYPSGFEVVFEYDVERERYVGNEIIHPEVWSGYYKNRRFSSLTIKEKIWHILYKKDEHIIDTETGEIMAQRINFYTDVKNRIAGHPAATLRDFKMWMLIESCISRKDDDRTKWRVNGESFSDYRQLIESLGENE